MKKFLMIVMLLGAVSFTFAFEGNLGPPLPVDQSDMLDQYDLVDVSATDNEVRISKAIEARVVRFKEQKNKLNPDSPVVLEERFEDSDIALPDHVPWQNRIQQKFKIGKIDNVVNCSMSGYNYAMRVAHA